MIDLFSLPSFDVIPTTSIWGTKTLLPTPTMIHLKPGHYIMRIKPKHPNLLKPITVASKLIAYSYHPL